MELTNDDVPAKVQYLGNEIFELPSEKRLMIKRTGGADILSAKVPVGKTWEVRLHIEIIETDA